MAKTDYSMLDDPALKKKVLVTARITKALRADLAKKQISIAQAIIRGSQSFDSFPRILERLHQSEEAVAKLQRRLTDFAVDNDRLEKKIAEISGEK